MNLEPIVFSLTQRQLCIPSLVQRPVLACPALVTGSIKNRNITNMVANTIRTEVSELDVLDEQGGGVQVHPRRIASIAAAEPPGFAGCEEAVTDTVTIEITRI